MDTDSLLMLYCFLVKVVDFLMGRTRGAAQSLKKELNVKM